MWLSSVVVHQGGTGDVTIMLASRLHVRVRIVVSTMVMRVLSLMLAARVRLRMFVQLQSSATSRAIDTMPRLR